MCLSLQIEQLFARNFYFSTHFSKSISKANKVQAWEAFRLIGIIFRRLFGRKFEIAEFNSPLPIQVDFIIQLQLVY